MCNYLAYEAILLCPHWWRTSLRFLQHAESPLGITRKSNKTESNYFERSKQSGQSVAEISSLVANDSTNLSNKLDCLGHEARVCVRGERLDMSRESRT